MLYKSKANRVGNISLAALGVRIIDTVAKSGIDQATSSKQFLVLQEVNSRYQASIVPGDAKQVSDSINALFKSRRILFDDMYEYVKGLTKSPSPEMKEAALLVFERLNKYGRSYSRVQIADQSVKYIRVIEGLKKPDIAAAVTKIMLTDKVAQLDQLQLDYEDLYLNRGNNSTVRVAPSSLRKEMQETVKLYVEELRWLTNTYDTEAWRALYRNVEQRFNEVNVSATRKKVTEPESPVATPAVPESPVATPAV